MHFFNLSSHPDFSARVEDAKVSLQGKNPNVVLFALPEEYVPRAAFPGQRAYLQSPRRAEFAAQAVAACSVATGSSVADVVAVSS